MCPAMDTALSLHSTGIFTAAHLLCKRDCHEPLVLPGHLDRPDFQACFTAAHLLRKVDCHELAVIARPPRCPYISRRVPCNDSHCCPLGAVRGQACEWVAVCCAQLLSAYRPLCCALSWPLWTLCRSKKHTINTSHLCTFKGQHTCFRHAADIHMISMLGADVENESGTRCPKLAGSM